VGAARAGGRVPLRRAGGPLSGAPDGGGVLVTGAGGQLGRALGALVPEAVLLSRADLDVTHREAVERAVARHRPAVVVHAAAWTAVDAAEADPEGARAVNVGGTEAVARAAERVGALLVYPSTDYVFGGDLGRPYREDDRPAPLSVYGRTKLEGEAAARALDRHLVVRTSWVFGEGRNFVRAVLGRAARGEELRVVADQVGLPTYALDLARGILALVEAGVTGTFHLAGGGAPCAWADLAEAALGAAVRAGLLRDPPSVRRVSTAEYDSARPGPVARRPAYSVLDCSKAAALGVRLRPWREALEEYVGALASRGREGLAGGAGG
jgi:dTDP-4-dehydrorhamnose reductase